MLKVLSSHISNLIAAGEVIQRPSSVVKELIENSIDAGADSIDIIIQDSGRTLIQVIDNGKGMTPEECSICFLRHATSKIEKAEDLNSIMSYGFRGEALASVAAVSEVTLKSREQKAEIGITCDFIEGKMVSPSTHPNECVIPVGTNISVRNLFYNVPARRKFLKSDASEFRDIIQEFIRIAICRPEVDMSLIHNSKNVFKLSRTLNIKQRILDTEGNTMLKELIDIHTTTSIISVSGFIGIPEEAKKRQTKQYLFANGRYFHSPYFNKAITKAYSNLIPDGYHPSFFIFMEANPESMDVNIHPTKAEIKFENESEIFELLNAAVREALGKNSLSATIDFDTEGTINIPVADLHKSYLIPPKINYDPLFNPFNQTDEEFEFLDHGSHKENHKEKYYNNIFEDASLCTNNIIQLHNKYLITPVSSGILLINIPRARERILYENYLKELDNFKPIVQSSLFSQIIDLDENSISILKEHKEKIEMMGFDIEFGKDNLITVNGLPDGFNTDAESIKTSIDDLIIILSDNTSKDIMKAEERHKIALKLAKSGASKKSKNLTSLEAQFLIDSLFGCSEPENTPDGLACMTILSSKELDKKFK
ncbi:MAG: DNA mismatch repair endonuclease MutL [Bacteroidales bacterium]